MSIEWYNKSGTLFKKAFETVGDAEARLKVLKSMDLSKESAAFGLNVMSEIAAIEEQMKGE